MIAGTSDDRTTLPAGTPPSAFAASAAISAQVRAVDDVSFDIADGEFFSMLGPSGSGKTTCLRLIAGFEQPTAGDILRARQGR